MSDRYCLSDAAPLYALLIVLIALLGAGLLLLWAVSLI